MTDNTSTAANNIRNRLVLSLALQPTLEWLEECIVYLKSKNKTVNVDTILFQVLYSDLRDVVREKTLSSSSNSSNNNNNNIFPPARQLREGIKHSSQANHDHQHTLPSSFALLCQLEELSDVSMTTQKRLEGSDHNNNNNNNYNYNQRPSRCLKVCMSHGYDCSNGDSNNNNDNNLNIVVGIETTMIPNLSVDALAGVKILLKGPILIRDSILLLNPKNCIAIGGCIEDLVRQQRDALKIAKRSAGVGVDATIRALIGTTGLEDEDDDNDEAHAEASGDVVVPRQRQQQQQQQQQQQPPPPTNRGVLLPAQLPSSRHQQQQVQPSSSSSFRNNNINNNNNINHPTTVGRIETVSQSSRASQFFRTDATTRSILTPTNNNTNNTARSTSSSTSSSSSSSATINPTTSSSLSMGTNRNGPTINPYMRGRGITTSLLSSSSNNTTAGGGGGGGGGTNSSRKIINAPVANPYNRSQHQQQRQETKVPAATARTTTTITTAHNSVATNTINNPYNRGKTSITETSTSRQQQHNIRTTTTTSHTARARVTPSPVPPFQSITNTTNDDMTPQSHAVSSTTTTTNNTSNTLIQNMPFATLYQLLLQLVDDREMYESQRNMIFRIKITALANQAPYFNVVKSKKNGNKSKKKEKKYEFFLSASFKSADTTDGTGNNDTLLLSCRIHPSLLHPHFSLPPHELRALSRTNNDESGRITTEGGQKVQKAYFSPRFWRATLNLTTEELFGEGSSISSKTATERLKNLETPILLLIPDHQ